MNADTTLPMHRIIAEREWETNYYGDWWDVTFYQETYHENGIFETVIERKLISKKRISGTTDPSLIDSFCEVFTYILNQK